MGVQGCWAVPGGGHPGRGRETGNQAPELLEKAPGRAQAEPWLAPVSREAVKRAPVSLP